jgi:hypothetical protein
MVEQVVEVYDTDPVKRDLSLVIGGHVNTGKLIVRGQPGFKNAILQHLMAKKHGVMLNGPAGIHVVPDP